MVEMRWNGWYHEGRLAEVDLIQRGGPSTISYLNAWPYIAHQEKALLWEVDEKWSSFLRIHCMGWDFFWIKDVWSWLAMKPQKNCISTNRVSHLICDIWSTSITSYNDNIKNVKNDNHQHHSNIQEVANGAEGNHEPFQQVRGWRWGSIVIIIVNIIIYQVRGRGERDSRHLQNQRHDHQQVEKKISSIWFGQNINTEFSFN